MFSSGKFARVERHMGRINDALIRAGSEREKIILSPLTAATRPQLEPQPPPELYLANEEALITVEVRLQRIYKSTVVRFVVLAFILVAALATATVYINNTHHPSGMTDSTVFEGTMQPVTDVKVTALEPGIISFVSAHVGDAVNGGDVLVTMDSYEADEAVARAQLAYDAAQRNFVRLRGELANVEAKVSAASQTASLIPARQVRDSVQHAQAVYDQALVDHQRTHGLYEDGIIAKQVLDASATALRIAKDDLENAHRGDSANSEMQRLQSRQFDLLSQISEREQAQQIKEARQALQAARSRLAKAAVRATSTGVVSAVSVRIGDQVSVGAPLVIISRLDRITVNVPVAASMIASLKKSQSAQITLPTVPPQQVLGRIRAISPVPSANMTHNVEIEFDNPTGELLAGQPAEVRFVFQ